VSDVQDYLAARGITPEVAERAGLFDVPNAAQIYPDFRSLPALVLPYHDLDGSPLAFERDGAELAFCRVRYMGELPPQRGRKKPLRYTQPADSGCRAYLPPGIDWTALAADPSEPVMITEGEIKALAASDIAPCIGLGGVFSTVRDGRFLSELDTFEWSGRLVYLCFDSDAKDNPNVAAAEARLIYELQTKRGARCRLMRLPGGEDGVKMGLDDYIVAYGRAAFMQLVGEASDLYALDAQVVALNRSVAWIERDGMVYDRRTREWVRKGDFVEGGWASSIVYFGPSKKGVESKPVKVAKTWLTHPLALRFDGAIFRPGEGDTVQTDTGRSCLNLWTGWEERPGDVQPFLDLSEFLFSRMGPADRDLLVHLFAYKFQNPTEKIPLAGVLIGPQGCGKSLWARCIREAAGAHGTAIPSSSVHSRFSEWQEHALVATIDEAEEEDLRRGRDILKGMISDKTRFMEAKYRPGRAIETFYQVIITSNSRAAGAFTADDRRMVVVDCPPKRETAFYDRIVAWLATGGAKALCHYLLNLDLNGWRPPNQAPLTAEKHMAYVEGLTAVQRFAEDCNNADENTVKQWLDAAMAWGEVNVAGANPVLAAQARAVLDSAAQWQVRPFYTPDELALMLPMFTEQSGAGRIGKRTTAGEISRQLRDAGIRYLQSRDDPRGFRWRGKLHQFLVIADTAEWAEPLGQDEFDRVMSQMPRYSQIRARRA
jgi:hypothetical protein